MSVASLSWASKTIHLGDKFQIASDQIINKATEMN